MVRNGKWGREKRSSPEVLSLHMTGQYLGAPKELILGDVSEIMSIREGEKGSGGPVNASKEKGPKGPRQLTVGDGGVP